MSLVLYIEDNPSNLRLVRQIFERIEGAELLTATHPTDGLQLAKSRQPKLVLLDMNLPDLDGFQVLQRLRSHPQTQSIPVIAVSANAMPGDIERALAAGFNRYICKPLVVKDFIDVIRSHLKAVP